MNRLIIIGASGHGKVVADIAKKTGYNDIVFLDDDTTIKGNAGYKVLGPVSMISDLDGDLFIAIGNDKVRRMLMNRESNRFFPILIHPDSVVADDVEIGMGTVVMAGVVINPGTVIGRGCIVNTSSSIDHDCRIGDFCHISVGSHIAGTVTVGDGTWVGEGSTVINNVNICNGCFIGAGAVVIRSIEEKGTYVGVPAKRIESK